MRPLIAILVGFSILFAGCAKRDVISGLPEIDKKEEPVLESVSDMSLLEIVGLLSVIAVGSVVMCSGLDGASRLLIKRFPWLKKHISP